MRVDVITLFPEMIAAALSFGITGRAVHRGLLTVATWNPRDYTHDPHRTVDDRPYGGGPGMVMKAQPLHDALCAAQQAVSSNTTDAPCVPARVIYLSPQGQPLTQQRVSQWAQASGLILIAGRYEGIDERFVAHAVDEECSIGDYVLSGGELAALVLIDAMARLLPGALNSAESALQESFVDGMLDCPHYTRPEAWEGHVVPPVLLSGDHGAIARWRQQVAFQRTQHRRPDLLVTGQQRPEGQQHRPFYTQNH